MDYRANTLVELTTRHHTLATKERAKGNGYRDNGNDLSMSRAAEGYCAAQWRATLPFCAIAWRK